MIRKALIILVVFLGGLAFTCGPPQWLFTRVLSPVICPGAVYAVGTSEKVVALTIDDGPDLRLGTTNSTTRILDILQHHNQQVPKYSAHATFFLIGNQVRQRELLNGGQLDPIISHIIEAGHEIGNHMANDGATILLTDWFYPQFDETHQRLTPYAQLPGSRYAQVSWFRPGVGWCDRSMVKQISQNPKYSSGKGFNHIALGSVWPYDTLQPWPVVSRWFIRRNIRPGSIIILHDGGSRGDRTAQVLEGLLQDLSKREYRLVPLSELLIYGNPIAPSQGFPKPIEAIRKRVVIGLETIRLR